MPPLALYRAPLEGRAPLFEKRCAKVNNFKNLNMAKIRALKYHQLLVLGFELGFL